MRFGQSRLRTYNLWLTQYWKLASAHWLLWHELWRNYYGKCLEAYTVEYATVYGAARWYATDLTRVPRQTEERCTIDVATSTTSFAACVIGSSDVAGNFDGRMRSSASAALLLRLHVSMWVCPKPFAIFSSSLQLAVCVQYKWVRQRRQRRWRRRRRLWRSQAPLATYWHAAVCCELSITIIECCDWQATEQGQGGRDRDFGERARDCWLVNWVNCRRIWCVARASNRRHSQSSPLPSHDPDNIVIIDICTQWACHDKHDNNNIRVTLGI